MTKVFICVVCGRPLIDDEKGNCPFCGAHRQYVGEYKAKKSRWKCTICQHVFDELPDSCPICGAGPNQFVEMAKTGDESQAKLAEIDIKNAQKALEVEVSNSTFYYCAAEKSDHDLERKLFLALGDVEYQHAIIWQKILDLPEMPEANDKCVSSSLENLKESHQREDTAIKFYAEAAESSQNARLKMLFKALVEIETDHLDMSQELIDKKG